METYFCKPCQNECIGIGNDDMTNIESWYCDECGMTYTANDEELLIA